MAQRDLRLVSLQHLPKKGGTGISSKEEPQIHDCRVNHRLLAPQRSAFEDCFANVSRADARRTFNRRTAEPLLWQDPWSDPVSNCAYKWHGYHVHQRGLYSPPGCSRHSCDCPLPLLGVWNPKLSSECSPVCVFGALSLKKSGGSGSVIFDRASVSLDSVGSRWVRCPSDFPLDPCYVGLSSLS